VEWTESMQRSLRDAILAYEQLILQVRNRSQDPGSRACGVGCGLFISDQFISDHWVSYFGQELEFDMIVEAPVALNQV
jgi:hypothetical protein